MDRIDIITTDVHEREPLINNPYFRIMAQELEWSQAKIEEIEQRRLFYGILQV